MKVQKEVVTRYVGIDLGKRTYQAAFVQKGAVKKSNGKTYVEGRQGLYAKLRPTDKVGLEACSLAFIMAKEMEAAVGCQVYVLNPHRLAVIYASMKKTDKEDSLKLAHMLEDFQEERLPLVPVPREKEMERRKVLAGYRRGQQSRVREINRLHGLFLAQGITTMKRRDLKTEQERKEAIKVLSGLEREEAEYLVTCLSLHENRIVALEKQMEEETAGDEEIQRLQSVPGVGPMVSFAFASHVAAERFENPGQLSNYLGLVPRVYMSGDTVRYGSITKRGNSYVRALLVQAAWSMVRSKDGGKLKEIYKDMTKDRSTSKKKAIVAVARRIGELLYTLMRDGTKYESKPYKRDKKEVEKLAQEALSA